MTVVELLRGSTVTGFGIVGYGELSGRFGRRELSSVCGFYTEYSNNLTVVITGGGAGGHDLVNCWVLNDEGVIVWEDETYMW
jgi:hypothetical protein